MAVGKIYFALVGEAEVFDPNVHNREDENVLQLAISQEEGDFASAEVEIENPGTGLLNPSRPKRVFISYDDGGSATLLFSGRIVGFPSDLATETIKLSYIAQPQDWKATQEAFVSSLKTAPFYNELFIPEDRRDDPAEIMAARSALFYWDRATNALTLSDILEGSTLKDLQDRVLFDSVSVSVGDPPLKSVNIAIETQWEQFGVGEVDCGTAIKNSFNNTVGPNNQINTLTPFAFEDGWSGARVPNGYSIIESKLVAVANSFGLAQADLRSQIIEVNAADFPFQNGGTVGTRQVSVPRIWYEPTLRLQAVYEQKRRELFSTVLSANTQDFSLRGELTEDISIRLQDPSAAAQGGVFDGKLPSFFYDTTLNQLTTLGAEAIEHAMLRGVARLKYANRVIETQLEGDLDELIDITTDHSLRFEDARVPGGSIQGKVVAYELVIDGDSGKVTAKVKLGSCIGNGLNSSGTGTEIALQSYDNEFGTPTMNSSVFYELDATPTIQEPIDVDQMETNDAYLIDGVVVDNPGQAQYNAFAAQDISSGPGRPDTYLTDNPTAVTVNLKSMNPDSELFAQINISSTDLTLPKHLDMEA